MHLAGKFFEAVVGNQRKICQAGASRQTFQDSYRVDDREISETFSILESDQYFLLALRIAALFHDIGHGPLSHLFDKFFPTINEITPLIRNTDYDFLTPLLAVKRPEDAHGPVRHEVISCMIAVRIILDTKSEFNRIGLEASDVARDICSIIDDRITPSNLMQSGQYSVQKLFHDILSSDLDIDRMDYLLRDSHMCGVNYGLYDPDRILKSMCAYACTDTGELRACIRYSGIGALEDLLIARYQMHAQIYGHKTNRACNAMLERIRERLCDTGWSWYKDCATIDDLLKTFCALDDHTFVNTLLDPALDHGNGKISEIASKLFVERKIVKRVFEERTTGSAAHKERDIATKARWTEHKKRLEEEGIWTAEDVFENKGPKINRPNYPLKVLRKSPIDGSYEVKELLDHSSVAHFLPELECTYRLFCKESYVKRAKQLLP
jgi:HD superfamily phosphohydrolase